ncbi:MAG: YncE family protein [Sedimentisphaeraceae bacterium JB056]
MLKSKVLINSLLVLCCLEMPLMAVSPQYVISANDQRWQLADSINAPFDNPDVGSITILDTSVMPPKQVDIPNIPCSVTGPPTCLVMSPDKSIILVAAAMKLDDAGKDQVPDNSVSVIDVAEGKLIDTLVVGKQPSGISISPDGKTALVCNRAEGSVTNLKISGKKVTVVSTVQISKPEESLSHIIFVPGDDFALASLQNTSSVVKISLEKGQAKEAVGRIEVGKGPYCLDATPDGKWIAVANVSDTTVSIIDTCGDDWKVTDSIFVGVIPEGLDVSGDGKYIAVSCLQYSMVKPDDSKRQQYGQVVLLKRQPQYFSIMQRLQVDRIPQGVAFTHDSKRLVVGGFENKRLKIYDLSNDKLEYTGICLDVPGQPCSLR